MILKEEYLKDGTLIIMVSDIDDVGRIIVTEDKSKFCKIFYQDEDD